MSENLDITVAKLMEQNKTLFVAMDKIDKRVSGVEDMALSVHDLASSIKQMTSTMEKMEQKVDNLTTEPASAWRKFKWILVGVLTTCIVGGIGTALFALIIK